MSRANVLFIMCDQLRADSIAALGNTQVKTPNIDRLAKRGVRFSQAYSTCPVCIPARYTIRTGRQPYNTGYYQNGNPILTQAQPKDIKQRCGDYLAQHMKELGYSTFGVGKFHAMPYNEALGFDVQLLAEEMYDTPEQRASDDYAAFIKREHPHFSYIEQLHGERTDMYYTPQTSPVPAKISAEAWVANQSIKLIQKQQGKPYFGFISFIAPHPPFSPPLPYNRMYNPDHMESPIKGLPENDLMDEQISWMNHLIWAEDISTAQAKSLKARYYGEITYLDSCVGEILDAVEKRKDADNTLICFFSDHGDHLGDHGAWQKESFFDAAARVPFLISWPKQLQKDQSSDFLLCLEDLFGIATTAAGSKDLRDGTDVLDSLIHQRPLQRSCVVGCYGVPGEFTFKMMLRTHQWKYIYMANGGREQLFDMSIDHNELKNCITQYPEVAKKMYDRAVEKCCAEQGLFPATKNGKLLATPYTKRPYERIHQFDASQGIYDFIES